MSDNNRMEVTLQIAPAQGRAATRTVAVERSGATVREVLQTAGVEHDRKNLKVNGKPAGLETHVPAGATVTVAERPRGS